MPSKLLIAAANAVHAARQGETFGFSADVHIDGAAVMARVRKERDAFVQGVKKDFAALPDGVCVRAKASFEAPTVLRLSDGRTVSAKAVAIATGAQSSIPDCLSGLGDRVLTNETIFELEELPRSVGVIGAGPLGLELAQALARLGVAVFDKG